MVSPVGINPVRTVAGGVGGGRSRRGIAKSIGIDKNDVSDA